MAEKRRREVHFKIGDKVWAYLRKERLLKDQHTKLQMNKIGPCTILHEFGENSYEITLPPSLSISPIFNIADLTPFKGNIDVESTNDEEETHADWLHELPPSQPIQLEKILNTKIYKKTRHTTYLAYLVKWRCLLDIDATWMTKHDIINHGYTLDQLASSGNLSFKQLG